MQIFHKERRLIRLYMLVLFLSLSVVFLIITLVMRLHTDQISQNEITLREQNLIAVGKTNITSKIDGRVSDMLYIADSLQLGKQAEDAYEEATLEWLAFSDRKTIYDQIRYLNNDGDEVIRINYTENGALAVPQTELQNKKDRYYFIQTMELKENQVFISPLDLNVENNRIEQPIKPILRLSTPLYTADGKPDGMVILNYSAQDILGSLQMIASASAEEVYLLNSDGYFLYHSGDSTREWAFMYEDRTADSFAHDYPEVWETITGTGDGMLQTDNGVFYYGKINLQVDFTENCIEPEALVDPGAFYIVAFLGADTEMGALFSDSIWRTAGKVFLEYLSIYFLLSGIAFVLAAFIAITKAQRKEIAYFSLYDAMTGVYNRRAGYRKLTDLQHSAVKADCKFVVCFIDINGLKEVNDKLGHDMGDALIQSVAKTIQDNLRSGDFVARLGGDEFMIVFEGVGEKDAAVIWERIVRKFDQINTEENHAYAISVSHGFAVSACGGGMTVDDIIKEADAKMYEEKRRVKQNLHVVREEV